jgi:hypothetical protein
VRGTSEKSGQTEKEKLLDRGTNMKLKITQVILTTAAVIIFALAPPLAFAQQDTPGKPTAKGQMKESGKEAGKAGKSLGHNVKHGRVVRGGKRFGKHMGYAGRHVGRGTKHAVKRAVKP